MDIVKKNLLSISCGVVALICIILLFYPFGGWYTDLQTEVSQSDAMGASINRVAKTPRHWPTLSSRPEDQVPLTQFPTNRIIEKGNELTVGWKNEAQRFFNETVDRQKRQLIPLQPGALPGSGAGSAVGIQFVEQYQRRFGIYVNPLTQKKDESQSIYNTILNAGLPPIEAEIKAEQERLAAKIKSEAQVIDNRVSPEEEQKNNQRIANETALIPELMRTVRAKEKSIYADPATLFRPVQFRDGVAPAASKMFDAQVNLWVLEEICRAIADTNKAANPKQGIIDSPIKRIVRLEDIKEYRPTVAPGSAQQGVLPAGATAKPTPDYQIGPFGHSSNEFYDPIPITNLVFICEADTLAQTLSRLTANRFITIRDVRVESVDSTLEAAAGFLYGPKPVVQVTINAQYLMLRPFIKDFMPADVIRGVLTPPNGAPGGMETPPY